MADFDETAEGIVAVFDALVFLIEGGDAATEGVVTGLRVRGTVFGSFRMVGLREAVIIVVDELGGVALRISDVALIAVGIVGVCCGQVAIGVFWIEIASSFFEASGTGAGIVVNVLGEITKRVDGEFDAANVIVEGLDDGVVCECGW